MNRWWHGFGPAMPVLPARETARASIGAALGLFLTAAILWALDGAGTPLMSSAVLIAPFGASAFLIFSFPASPFAQPWPAVVGNTISALAALGVLQLGLPMLPAISLAVLLAMVAMSLARALHPPGGAVAIATVLLARADQMPALSFALMPVCAGTAALVVAGVLWNLATGRAYPVPPMPRGG